MAAEEFENPLTRPVPGVTILPDGDCYQLSIESGDGIRVFGQTLTRDQALTVADAFHAKFGWPVFLYLVKPDVAD